MCVYLFGATDAYEILKLPLLVQHYLEHKKEDPGISLSGFLHMHYSPIIVVDKDFQQDMQLPFKTTDSICCCLSVVTIVSEPISVKHELTTEVSVTHTPKYTHLIAITNTSSIFQPPKA